MTVELLCKIADIINSNSQIYHAVVPPAKRDYMVHQGGSLVRYSCYVLHIVKAQKKKRRILRAVWNIYEKDIDKIIRKICRRDAPFAARIAQCEPTKQDVELLIRRASFNSLRLKISDSLLYQYIKDGDSDITR